MDASAQHATCEKWIHSQFKFLTLVMDTCLHGKLSRFSVFLHTSRSNGLAFQGELASKAKAASKLRTVGQEHFISRSGLSKPIAFLTTVGASWLVESGAPLFLSSVCDSKASLNKPNGGRSVQEGNILGGWVLQAVALAVPFQPKSWLRCKLPAQRMQDFASFVSVRIGVEYVPKPCFG